MNFKYDYECINLIADAIREPAARGNYDWLLLGISGVGTIISILALCLTYRIYKRQIEFMKQQNAIIERQTELMEQQNRITAFDKKHELYTLISKLCFNISLIRGDLCLDISIGENTTKEKCLCCLFREIEELSFSIFDNLSPFEIKIETDAKMQKLYDKIEKNSKLFESITDSEGNAFPTTELSLLVEFYFELIQIEKPNQAIIDKATKLYNQLTYSKGKIRKQL